MSAKPKLNKDDLVIINGNPSRIIKNAGDGKEWKLENANIQTVTIIEALLRNKENSFKYEKGLTIIYPLSTIDLVGLKNGITRPSNHIGVIREYVGSDVLITFTVSRSRPNYGVIKSEKNIKKMEELKAKIYQLLSMKHK